MLTIIGLSHAEHVADRATRRVSDDNHPVLQAAVADDSTFTVVHARVFDLYGRSFKHDQSIFEVKAALSESLLSLGWIERQAHLVSVSTKTIRGNVIVETVALSLRQACLTSAEVVAQVGTRRNGRRCEVAWPRVACRGGSNAAKRAEHFSDHILGSRLSHHISHYVWLCQPVFVFFGYASQCERGTTLFVDDRLVTPDDAAATNPEMRATPILPVHRWV